MEASSKSNGARVRIGGAWFFIEIVVRVPHDNHAEIPDGRKNGTARANHHVRPTVEGREERRVTGVRSLGATELDVVNGAFRESASKPIHITLIARENDRASIRIEAFERFDHEGNPGINGVEDKGGAWRGLASA